MQRATAESLFEMAGLDFDEAKQQAADRAFEPVPLGVTGSLRVRNELRRIDSQNVVAKIEGSEAPDEVVMYVAHWDHMGIDPNLDGDQVFNGAADNAHRHGSGLIEIARAFIHAEEPPRRSVLFLAVTAEEQGLLGSRHYAENPLYPTAQTVAALNMDALNQWGRTRDMIIVGMGQSELDDVAADIARRSSGAPWPRTRSRRRASTIGLITSRSPGRASRPSTPTPASSTSTGRKATASKNARSTPRTTTTRCRTR